jgi:hypothetical protein
MQVYDASDEIKLQVINAQEDLGRIDLVILLFHLRLECTQNEFCIGRF